MIYKWTFRHLKSSLFDIFCEHSYKYTTLIHCRLLEWMANTENFWAKAWNKIVDKFGEVEKIMTRDSSFSFAIFFSPQTKANISYLFGLHISIRWRFIGQLVELFSTWTSPTSQHVFKNTKRNPKRMSRSILKPSKKDCEEFW